MSLAERPRVDPAAVLADRRPSPVVLLEDPRDLGNMGACVRVAAAADIAGVLTTGSHDPWHPDALRGAAGLHYAVAVARLQGLEPLAGSDRPLLAVDPGRRSTRPPELPPRALLAFGTERHGLSEELTARAEAHVSIPMRPGVSSLNLATSVAAVLFAWRLSLAPRLGAGLRALGRGGLHAVQEAPVTTQRCARAAHHPLGLVLGILHAGHQLGDQLARVLRMLTIAQLVQPEVLNLRPLRGVAVVDAQTLDLRP